jgi:hypothetical protein
MRAAALQCRATISFHHLDGQDVFGRSMEARWANSPEPAGLDGVGGVARQGSDTTDTIHIRIFDPMRLSLVSRIDVYPGESEVLDVVARFDNEEECYGWNNESYLRDPLWRNQKFKLNRGRYLLKVTVSSSGQSCVGYFRLINDVPQSDFRLENATAAQRRAIETSSG